MKNFSDGISPHNVEPAAPKGEPDYDTLSASGAGRFARAVVMRFWSYICALPMRRTLLRQHLTSLKDYIKAVHECEIADYHRAMKDALMADETWQAQVREDLGGEAAMDAWQARFDKAQASMDMDFEPAQKEQTQPALKVANTQRPESGVKTDRGGLFRMEVIRKRPIWDRLQKTQKTDFRTSRPVTDKARRLRAAAKYLPPLTPLRPEDLRLPEIVQHIRALTLKELAIWRSAIAAEQEMWAEKIAGLWHGYDPANFPAKAPP